MTTKEKMVTHGYNYVMIARIQLPSEFNTVYKNGSSKHTGYQEWFLQIQKQPPGCLSCLKRLKYYQRQSPNLHPEKMIKGTIREV
jgi:hypothetical protein